MVPDKLRVDIVVPIYIKSDKCQLKPYRPVSLLAAFSKRLETKFNKVIAFLDSNHMLTTYQYGCRADHSVVRLILHLLNNSTEFNNTNPKEYTLSICVIYQKRLTSLTTTFYWTYNSLWIARNRLWLGF